MKTFYAGLAALLLTITLPWSTSRGDAISLDGVGDWVELVGTDIPTGNAPFTIGAWINPTSIPAGGLNGGQVTFWGTQGPASTANGLRLFGESGVRHYFWGNDHDESYPSGSVLADTTGPNGDGWHHMAITYDGNQTTHYYNGQQLGSPRVAGSVNVAAANYRIGARLGAEFFHGFIDEVTIWNVPLDAPTIAAGYNRPVNASDPMISPFLVAYHDFENGLTDVAGGNNNGTFMGDAFIQAGVNAPLIPEPSSGMLCVLGALCLVGLHRRGQRIG